MCYIELSTGIVKMPSESVQYMHFVDYTSINDPLYKHACSCDTQSLCSYRFCRLNHRVNRWINPLDHGLSSIRVVSSAVAPGVLSGGSHSAAATTAIAERAADFIKGARLFEEGLRISSRRGNLTHTPYAVGPIAFAAPVSVPLAQKVGDCISAAASQTAAPARIDPSWIMDPQTPSPVSDVRATIHRSGDSSGDIDGNSGSSSGGGGGGGSVDSSGGHRGHSSSSSDGGNIRALGEGGVMSSSMWTSLSPPSTPGGLGAVASPPPSTEPTTGDGTDHWDLVEDSDAF